MEAGYHVRSAKGGVLRRRVPRLGKGREARKGCHLVLRRTLTKRRAVPESRVNETREVASYDANSGGGDGTGGSSKGYGGGDGDGEGDGKGKHWVDASAFLSAIGRSVDSLPTNFGAKVTAGVIPVEILKRYIEMESNAVFRALMKIPAFRDKILADPSFIFKLGIEVGIGICTKCSAEYQKRKQNFRKEFDFVFANVLMALIADFMLVWLPAPSVSYTVSKAKHSTKQVLPFLSKLPQNAFQKVPIGMDRFSALQRGGAIGANGFKLFSIGVFASSVGVAVTNGLIALRERMTSEDAKGVSRPQNVLAMSLMYGGFMGTNANLRYQAVAGFEERVMSQVFKGSLYSFSCAALRICNTFLGSLMWIDTLRLFGMQPKAAGNQKAIEDGRKKG
mmetsp:Transcript_10930/g.27592  ORF Transcript_10930/g.27592 Transcript_10930/m.27592 type:complete len:392 (+) Transcript_10930:236-1411(+)